jgi:hypothetical protein
MTVGNNFEIGRILHLKSEIRNLRLNSRYFQTSVQFAISDFGFEVQDLSNFKISVMALQAGPIESDCSGAEKYRNPRGAAPRGSCGHPCHHRALIDPLPAVGM